MQVSLTRILTYMKCPEGHDHTALGAGTSRSQQPAGHVGWTREITLPGLPQIRTCGTTASGSSNHGLAPGRQVE